MHPISCSRKLLELPAIGESVDSVFSRVAEFFETPIPEAPSNLSDWNITLERPEYTGIRSFFSLAMRLVELPSLKACKSVEDATGLDDEITNLAKIAKSIYIPTYVPLAKGTDVEKVEYFRTWVSEHPEECAAEYFLDLSNLGLTTFPPEIASYFPNIAILNLDQNRLTSISLSDLPRLNNANLCDNKLTSVILSNLPELENLFLSNNELTSLNLLGAPQLNWLDLSGNKLTSLDLSNSPGLLGLDLRGNKITSLNLSGLTELWYLDGSKNQLNSIAFKTIERVRLSVGSSMDEIYLSMHDLNVHFKADVRADIIEKYNEIKEPELPALRADRSGEFLVEGKESINHRAFEKATIQVILERSGWVIT